MVSFKHEESMRFNRISKNDKNSPANDETNFADHDFEVNSLKK